MKINSLYGYRKDPFTGKKKFHNGIDLHARGDEVMAMMAGVVVKVGQDKSSGKYVTLRHGDYTVSYCHLSRILTRKGAAIGPRDVVGITRFYRTQHQRTPAYFLQARWKKCRSVNGTGLHQVHTRRVRGGTGQSREAPALSPAGGKHR